MSWEAIFHQWSERQYGLVARFQLPAMGCTIQDWWSARRSGRWWVCSSRVIASLGAPRSQEQRVLAAELDASPGAVLHHPSALAWLGFRGFTLRRIAVVRPRGLNGTPATLARVHRLRALRGTDVILHRGVVTETALRAIWCEAARYARPELHDIGADKIGRLIDEANRLGLLTYLALNTSVEELQRRGRAGTVIMRRLAEARPPGTSATDSRQEERLESILDDAGDRRLRRQVHVGGAEPIGRCDLRDEELPLVVEVNSELHHSTPSDRDDDIVRYRKLNDAGFTVGVAWEDDLWKRPYRALELVRAARQAANAGQRLVLHSPGCPWPDPLPSTHTVLGP